MKPLYYLIGGGLLALSHAATAAVTSYSESFETGIQDWSTTLNNGASAATLTSVASGGADGGAYISQTGDVFFGAFGPVGVVFRCNNDSGLNCSDGNFFGDYDPPNNDTTLSFFLRHDASTDLDFFVRLAPATNSPGAGTGAGAPAFNASVASGVWTQLSLSIEANYFDSFSATDFDTVFSNLIERIQIGVTLPFNPVSQSFDPLVSVNFDLDSVALTNTAVPVPAASWLLGSSLLALGGQRLRQKKLARSKTPNSL